MPLLKLATVTLLKPVQYSENLTENVRLIFVIGNLKSFHLENLDGNLGFKNNYISVEIYVDLVWSDVRGVSCELGLDTPSQRSPDQQTGAPR